MRIEALECFHEIMKSGSIRQAATNRYITQQGLSKVVQSLEAELGVPLFQKSGRNVIPTAQGIMLDEFAQTVIEDYEDLRQRLKALSVSEGTESSSAIVLWTTPFVGNGLFNMLRTEMDEAQVGVDRLMVHESSFENIIESFKAGHIDLALLNMREDDYAQLRSHVKPVVLFTSEVMLMVPLDIYRTLPGKTVTPDVFTTLPIAYYNDHVLNRLVRKFCEFGVNPETESRLLNHTTNISNIHAMVNKGLAVTFSDTFSLSVHNVMEGAVPVPLDPPQRFIVCFLVDPALGDSSPQRRYISRFKEMLYDNHSAFIRDSFINL
ncbi:MAG: LysR family transcriptional regulator [Coriobacteriales bacterium]